MISDFFLKKLKKHLFCPEYTELDKTDVTIGFSAKFQSICYFYHPKRPSGGPISTFFYYNSNSDSLLIAMLLIYFILLTFVIPLCL